MNTQVEVETDEDWRTSLVVKAADRVEQVEAILERRRKARLAKSILQQRERDYAERAAEAASVAPW